MVILRATIDTITQKKKKTNELKWCIKNTYLTYK